VTHQWLKRRCCSTRLSRRCRSPRGAFSAISFFRQDPDQVRKIPVDAASAQAGVRVVPPAVARRGAASPPTWC
jgi:hypothetical protein